MSRMAPTDQQRIMMIAPTPYFSDRGCHVRIFEEAQGLIAAGHQVRVVTYPLGRDVEPVPVVRTIAVPWYTKHGAGPSWHKPYLDLLLCLRALREVRRFRPTVIHAHLHEGALIGWVIARLSGVPLLFDYQGSLSGELLHHGSYRRGGVLHRCFRRLEQCINGLATMVVTSSTAGAAEVREGSPRQSVVSLPDGVDTKRFMPGDRLAARQELAIPDNRPVAVFIGLMNQYQGVDLLLEAVQHIRRAGHPLFTIIMGFPDHPYQAMADRYGIRDAVRFTGRVDYQHVSRLLAAGDIAVAPKIATTEANGKILNYMACGLPVVAFDTPVNRELLGDDGIYVPLGDARQLAAAMMALADQPDHSALLGKQMRQRAVEQLSWQCRISELLNCYTRVQERR